MDHLPSLQSDRLSEAHAQLHRIAERRGLEEVLSGLEDAAHRLRETSFRLIVLGEYKRGKSTLINALLGKAILPMAVVPLTSIVTEVRHGEDPSATIEFLDGGSLGIGVDELPAYVTEPENPRNHKRVRRAIVHDPAPLLAEGVSVLDTPGVGSVFEHNTELTYEILEESDAVIIVLAADQPLSAEERELLCALGDITDRILFVVNRADVLDADELAKSLRFIRNVLVETEGHPPEHVFPLSARTALEACRSGSPVPIDFTCFSKSLHRILIERKSAILLERAITVTRRAADLLALRLETEQRASSLAATELQRAIDRFREASVVIAERLDQSVVLLRHQVNRIHDVQLRRIEDARRQALLAELWPPVAEALRRRDGFRSRGWADQMALDIGRRVVDRLRPFYHESEGVVRTGLDRALEEHMLRVQAAMHEAVTAANDLLGMRAEVPPALAPLSERPGFYFKDWDGSGGQFRGSRWWFRLPRRIADRRITGMFRELLERRINQNLSAVHYDWVMRLDDAVRSWQASCRGQIEATQRMIVEALEQAQRLQTSGPEEGALALASDLELTRALSRGLGRSLVPQPDSLDPAGDAPPPSGGDAFS
jgi:GTP-binding protein EngB required for normal cell division